ncbi:MAG: hypothetical protein CVT86_04950 [Alphaproteobacteria bacterium HGW-Alphaproteobacteria-8]|nr:MAG: hypothetical protein CVT86_04950 [Alphaproteobacteria bacterium HGW-Alphaproteobacteria-8]
MLGPPEAERVHRRDRARAHGEHVAQDAAHPGPRALIRLDIAGVVVALHLEHHRLAVADIHHARVLAGAADHLRPFGRQGAQPFFRRFVGAMFVPHRREDAEFGVARRAAEDVEDAGVFVGLETKLLGQRLGDGGFGGVDCLGHGVAHPAWAAGTELSDQPTGSLGGAAVSSGRAGLQSIAGCIEGGSAPWGRAAVGLRRDRYGEATMGATPTTQRVTTPEQLAHIVFTDGLAAVTMPVEMLDHIRFKNDHRENGPRLATLERSIMSRGYVPMEPIIARIGQKGKWVVVDGGHRLTAARRIAKSFWANLFSKKVGDLYFLLFTSPRSWSKLRELAPQAELSATPPALADD